MAETDSEVLKRYSTSCGACIDCLDMIMYDELIWVSQSIGTGSDSTLMYVPDVLRTYKSNLGDESEQRSAPMPESSQTNPATTACKLRSNSCLE